MYSKVIQTTDTHIIKFFFIFFSIIWASQMVLVVKNLPANARDVRHMGSIPGSGTSPGGRHGIPLQDSCLGNPMDREAWWATVHGAEKESDVT